MTETVFEKFATAAATLKLDFSSEEFALYAEEHPQAHPAFQDKQKERQAEPFSARTPTLFASHIRLYSARIFGPLLESSLSPLPSHGRQYEYLSP